MRSFAFRGLFLLLMLSTQLLNVNAQDRDLKFLATGDPQYENAPNASDARKAKRALTDATMGGLNALLNTGTYSGLIVAGDLTMWSKREEFWAYERVREPMKDLYYEGLGNHDMVIGNCYAGYWEKCPKDIEDDIKRTKRSQYINGQKKDITLNFQGDLPHYSWDWGDVHFVQLNLFPGMRIPEVTPHDGNEYDLNPKASLMFLINDLLFKVGTSGKPVVLIHHYHIGANEWNEAEKQVYWDIISNYNVVAIITGHAHGPSDDFEVWDREEKQMKINQEKWNYSWSRPAGTTKGPKEIPTFIVGAALAGRYTTFHITEDKMKVTYSANNTTNRVSWAPICVEYPLDKNEDRTGTPCSEEEKPDIEVYSITGPNNDKDYIWSYFEPSPNSIPSNQVEVCLEVGETSSGWWKGIGLNTKDPTIEGNRGDGIQCAKVGVGEVSVNYWKGMRLGVHDYLTNEMIDLRNAGGKRFMIKWVKD